MTRAEIDKMIYEIEKKYCVDCIYIQATDDLDKDELRVRPNTYISFRGHGINKERIIEELDKLDLIRF